MSAQIIDWRVTSKCNSNCGFCYALNGTTVTDITKQQVEQVVKEIASTQCSSVCITGGEPLLNPQRTIDIMKQLHKYGIALLLSTNGTNFIECINDIEPLISRLSLPLDGYNTQDSTINGRIESNFEKVKEILDLYKKKQHNFPIKIGTLLSKKNMDIEHFKNMHEFLKQYTIDLWKIYQFIPEGRGETNKADYLIEDSLYISFVSELQKYFDSNSLDRNFDITFVSRKERNSAYFIIQPDASVIIPIDDGAICTEKNIGNLSTNKIYNVMAKWEECNNKMNVIGNNEKRNINRPIHKLHIDEIDKKLLYLFDEQPLLDDDKLAQSLCLDVDTVTNKMKKLYQIRAIKQIIPIVNVSNFGFDLYLVNLFFSVQNTTSHIIDILCNNPNIGWVAECYDWDRTDRNAIFRIAIYAENNNKYREILKEIEDIFGKQLIKYETEIVPEKYVCAQRYMLKEKKQSGMDTSRILLKHNTVFLSKTELRLFKLLRDMQRPSINNIAIQMQCNTKKIEKILESLRRKIIINKFQAVYDSNILGFNTYLLFVKFKSNFQKHKEEFENFVKDKNKVTHINTLNSGTWDIDVEIKVERSEQCFTLIEEITKQFGIHIQSKRIIRIEKEHKFEFLIPVVIDAAEKQCEPSFFKKILNRKK